MLYRKIFPAVKIPIFFSLCCVHFIIYQEKIERLRFERVKIDSQEEKQNIFKNKAFSKTKKHFEK